MRNLFKKYADENNLTNQLKEKSMAVQCINKLLPKAKKQAKNGYYYCEIKLNRHERKYARYFRDILKNKGFCDSDIKVLEKTLILKWK